MRGRQWSADRVAAANRLDAFHSDGDDHPLILQFQETILFPETFQTFPKHSKIHPDSRNIPDPETFLTQKTASLIVSSTPLLWYANIHSQRRVEFRVSY